MLINLCRTKKFIQLSCLLLTLLSFSHISSANVDPIQLMESITAKLMDALKKNKAEIDANPGKIYDVVDTLVVPHVDFVEMAKWVAGRSSWGRASDATKQEFVREFQGLVVRTYATSLSRYTDERIEFSPYAGEHNKRIQVSSVIYRQNKENIKLDYRLITHNNSWRVYDLVIEGVSILKGFQAQFTDKIKREGLAIVTRDIKEHNRKRSNNINEA